MNEVLTPGKLRSCLGCGASYKRALGAGTSYLCGDCRKVSKWCSRASHIVSLSHAVSRKKTNSCKSCASDVSREARGKLRERLNQIKLEAGCADCGYRGHPAALDFDHLPGEVKLFDISRGTVRSWESTLLEIKKCVVRCANCHRIKTFERAREGESE
jgi:hypothetical protein